MGFFVCDKCKVGIGLGKVLRRPDDSVMGFHAGPREAPENWERDDLVKVLFKFLANHFGHSLAVRTDDEIDDGVCLIGGDRSHEPSFGEYLKS